MKKSKITAKNRPPNIESAGVNAARTQSVTSSSFHRRRSSASVHRLVRKLCTPWRLTRSQCRLIEWWQRHDDAARGCAGLTSARVDFFLGKVWCGDLGPSKRERRRLIRSYLLAYHEERSAAKAATAQA